MQTVAAADTGAVILEGFVRNEEGNPLVGAVVSLFKENWTEKIIQSAKSRRDGSFIMENLEPGRYVLNVAKTGYEPLTYSILAPLKQAPLFVVLKGLGQGDKAGKNWGVDTVLRASTDRNVIFRNQDGGAPPSDGRRVLKEADKPGVRGGQILFTTSQPLGGLGYNVWPSPLATGFSTRFAYVEPLSTNSNFVVTGLITSGTDSQYQIKNMVNYQVSPGHKVQLSLRYDKAGAKERAIQDMDQVNSSTIESAILKTIEPIQTINVGIQDYFQIFEPLTVVYGFDIDYAKASRGMTRINPRFQLYLNPAQDMSFRFMLNNDRVTRDNTLTLPEGTPVTLASPTLIGKFGDNAFVNHLDHMEAGILLPPRRQDQPGDQHLPRRDRRIRLPLRGDPEEPRRRSDPDRPAAAGRDQLQGLPLQPPPRMEPRHHHLGAVRLWFRRHPGHAGRLAWRKRRRTGARP